MRSVIVVGAVLAALATVPATRAEGPLMQAMQDELKRSMEQLELEELQKPYFISYAIKDVERTTVEASFGSLVGSNESKYRSLMVEVRVGDYELDNTNFFSPSFGGGRSGVMRNTGGRATLPLDDDYDEIRRQIWLTTDGIYKQSTENYSKKQAALKSKTSTEEIPDFSRVEPAQITDEQPRVTVDLVAAQRLVKELSSLFRRMPDVYSSGVTFRAQNVRSRYLNSEGSSFVKDRPLVTVIVRAATQAEDGLPLEDFVIAYGKQMEDLPSQEELSARVKEMGARIAKLRSAPLLELYNGPVLFEGQAAAELFAQAFAPKLIANRLPVTDDPRMGGYLSQMQSSFEDKMGARVLPRSMQVTDDATAERQNETILLGGYKVDDQGVRARPTKLVVGGLLKTLLANRTPTVAVSQSTGNSRSRGILPSNLVVSSGQPMSPEDLKRELISLVNEREAEYGILVRRIANPLLRDHRDLLMSMMSSGRGSMGQAVTLSLIQAYKVYPDGREQLVRNSELSGVSAANFKEIVAATASDTVYSAPFSGGASGALANPLGMAGGLGGSGGGGPVVSWVVPSVLFEELTLKKPMGQVPNPPVVPHPSFDSGQKQNKSGGT